MAYHLDFSGLPLEFLVRRLSEEDLIPSQLPLREGLAENIASLRAAGIETLADLSGALKNDKGMLKLAAATGIGPEYLKLLGRALRGYAPKAALLADYPEADGKAVAALARQGIRDSAALWAAARRMADRKRLAADTGVSSADLETLACLSDLSRIQWVSPLFAWLIYDAGFRTVADVARARAEDLAVEVAEVNKRKNLFKGKIGERDMGRLVFLAGLLPHELEI